MAMITSPTLGKEELHSFFSEHGLTVHENSLERFIVDVSRKISLPESQLAAVALLHALVLQHEFFTQTNLSEIDLQGFFSEDEGQVDVVELFTLNFPLSAEGNYTGIFSAALELEEEDRRSSLLFSLRLLQEVLQRNSVRKAEQPELVRTISPSDHMEEQSSTSSLEKNTKNSERLLPRSARFVFDSDLRIVGITNASTSLVDLGYDNFALGQNLGKLIPDLEKALRNVVNNGTIEAGFFTLPQDDSSFSARISQPVRGTPLFEVSINEDQEDMIMKRLDKEIKKLRHDTFAAIHAIDMATTELHGLPELSTIENPNLRMKIIKETARLHNMIKRNLLNLKMIYSMGLESKNISRKIDLRPTNIVNFLREFLGSYIESAQFAIDQRFELIFGDGLSEELMIDQAKVSSIIWNLIMNSYRFTSKGTINAIVYMEDDELVMIVQDTGAGIPEEQQKNIFTDGYSTPYIDGYTGQKVKSTGFGLGLVMDFTRMQGGTIEIESETDEVTHGTSIKVRIPVKKAASPTPSLFS